LGCPEQVLEDEPVESFNGDIFLGLDLQQAVVSHHADFYQHLRRIGVQVYFVIYDLLPVVLPEAFPEMTFDIHAKWLNTLAQTDGAICISRSVADEMAQWLDGFGPKRLLPFKLGWFHLGADLDGSISTTGFPPDAGQVLEALTSRPTFLMVGTIVPRKGHVQTLAAFEHLWDQGVDVNLVIVGKHGWMVETLIDRIQSHPKQNRRLFWLGGISDEYLGKIYDASICLITASEGEGFGLPIIEAAQHHLPIIARDIPVFREVAGKHAFYFSGAAPTDLANSVHAWLALHKAGKTPHSDGMPRLTWKESTQNLLDVIRGGNWYREWMPDKVHHRFCGADSRLLSQVGKRTGQNIVSTGQAGYLIYGLYIPLDAGQYRVVVCGALGENGATSARIDVAIGRGSRILAESILSQPDQDGCLVSLPISLDAPCTDLEVRVIVDGHSDLTLSLLEINSIPPSEGKGSEDSPPAKYVEVSIPAEQLPSPPLQPLAETQSSAISSQGEAPASRKVNPKKKTKYKKRR
jgi:glycosyltransferase involved in cell wall biosynthesis